MCRRFISLSIPYRILTGANAVEIMSVPSLTLSIPYRILTYSLVTVYHVCITLSIPYRILTSSYAFSPHIGQITFNSLPDSHIIRRENEWFIYITIFQFPTGFSQNISSLSLKPHCLSIPYRILTGLMQIRIVVDRIFQFPTGFSLLNGRYQWLRIQHPFNSLPDSH